MEPHEALKKLREQAQSIPHSSVPLLRQRKRVLGASSFSFDDTAAQTAFPPSL
jgi:hypothetical protein